MEGQFQTSFIPKKPVTAKASGGTKGVSIILLLAIIIFLASASGAAAVFIYQTYLQNSISSMQKSFQLSENAFDPESVSTYATLNKRITVANSLLKNHIAVSNLFAVLGQSTLKTVRFSSFSFVVGASGKSTLAMKGQARDNNNNYNSVAKQAEVFSENPVSKYITNPIFDGLNTDQNGNAIFNFTADVQNSQILYSSNLNNQ
ncbi:MAG: hypothetical protein WCI52_03740 [bacterium]